MRTLMRNSLCKSGIKYMTMKLVLALTLTITLTLKPILNKLLGLYQVNLNLTPIRNLPR